MKATLWTKRLTSLARNSPAFLLAGWFLLLLAAGTVLLALPLTHQIGGPEVTWLAALFTAASAFCVTGLTLVETPDAFNACGQAVILTLIELGGVGIMAFAALAFSMMGRRLSLAGRAALSDTLFQNNPVLELKAIFRSMFKAVFLIQAAGFILLYLALAGSPSTETPQPNPAWSALFHSVSAFCNAGFSIYRDNLTPLAGNRAFLSVIMVLVVLGGLGHGTLAELYRLPGILVGKNRKPRLLSPNSRVVLIATAILLILGAAILVASDYWYGKPPQGAFAALFHSVVSRTAGFNIADMGAIPLPSCLLLCILMFVGGSPGSCAGGIKTTSTAIWLARIAANLRQSTDVTVLRYSLPQDLVSKSRIIIALSTLWVVFGVTFLACCEPGIGLDRLLFEQVSAFATSGLSMGLTPHLNRLSQLWIILSMIMGKFGPLTVALWMVAPTQRRIRHPEGRLMIG